MSLEPIEDDYTNESFDHTLLRNYSERGNMSSNLSIPISIEVNLTAQDYILIVMYSMTTLLAIFGNTLAIVVFTKGKRSKSELRPFLINLAIADLIVAIFCIPFTFSYQLLGENWIFSKPMCPIILFLQLLSVTASVSTNIAVGIDRFWGIAFPLSATRSNPAKYRIIIAVIWIISIAFASVQFFVSKTSQIPGTNQIKCNEEWPSPDMLLNYTILVLVLTYLVPVVVLTVTYSMVGYLLWKRNLPGNADAQRDQSQLKSKVKIVKMLVTIVVLFVLCWLPIHTFFLVMYMSQDVVHSQTVILVYFICHWIAMSNSFVNPIVYCSLNDSFRADVKYLLSRCMSANGSYDGITKFKYRSDQYIVNPVHKRGSNLSLNIGVGASTPRLQRSLYSNKSAPSSMKRQYGKHLDVNGK